MMTDKNTFVLTDDDRRFIKTARKILANEKVQQMKQYVQHGDVSTYEHCLMVCLYAYMYAKRLKLKINIEALVKGCIHKGRPARIFTSRDRRAQCKEHISSDGKRAWDNNKSYVAADIDQTSEKQGSVAGMLGG